MKLLDVRKLVKRTLAGLGERARLPAASTPAAPAPAASCPFHEKPTDQVTGPTVPRSRIGAAQFTTWGLGPPQRISTKELLYAFEALQDEHGLSRHPLPQGPDVHGAIEPQRAQQKTALYAQLDDLVARFWSSAESELAAKTLEWRERRAAGESLTAPELSHEIRVCLDDVLADLIVSLTPGEAQAYRDALPGSELPMWRDAPSQRSGLHDHFHGGLDVAIDFNLTFIEDLEPLLTRFLSEKGARLPARCHGSAADLFQQPFLKDGLALLGYLASSHMTLLPVAEELLNLSGISREDVSPPGRSGLAIGVREGALHLELAPETRPALARVPEALREKLTVAPGPLLTCPAKRVYVPRHGNVTGAFRDFVVEAAREFVFPDAAQRLARLHAKVAKRS